MSTQDKKLISYDSSGKLLREENTDSSYRFLCYSGENLYGYDYSQSAIVDLMEATPRIVENSLSFRTIYNMVAIDDTLYVLAVPDNPDHQGDGSSIIDVKSGQYSTIDLEHIIAMYRTEGGKLYFYGWQESQYYLYEYDTQKNRVTSKLHQDAMGHLSNLVVEGGYLFGFQGIGNANGLQAGNEMDRLLAEMGVLDGLPIGNDSKQEEDIDEIASIAASFPQRTETIALSMSGYNDTIDVSAVSKISGMKTKIVEPPMGLEAMLTELMAGNHNVDIYIYATTSVFSVSCRRMGLYVPLNESEIITQYLDGCFEYVGEAATAPNEDIWMLPVQSTILGQYLLMQSLDWLDKRQAVALPQMRQKGKNGQMRESI